MTTLGIRYEMGRSSIIDDNVPSHEILESLYSLRIRVSDQLKKRIGIVRHGDSPEEIGSLLFNS